jgi:hypothetical protein
MSKRIQSGVSILDELEFPIELGIETLILKVIGFANIEIVGFDPTTIEVEDIVVGVLHASLFMKVDPWLKTNLDVNGQQWSILQSSENSIYFTSFWPFEMS